MLTIVAAVQLAHQTAGFCQAAPDSEREVRSQDSNVATALPAAGPPPAAGPNVVLRATSLKARLQVMDPRLEWRDVCVMPCLVPVDPAGTYRVGGDTIRPSISFSMPRSSGQVVIDSKVGSKVKHWVGISLLATGFAGAGFGGYGLATAGDQAGWAGVYRAAGGITLIVAGVIMIAVGIPLSLSSTSVEVH